MTRLGVIALILVAACGTPRASDTNSNWLRQCSTQRECGAKLDCICGICTQECTSAVVCGKQPGAGAACVETSDPDLIKSCPSASNHAEPAICLLICASDAACGEEQRCVNRLCVSASRVQDGSVQDANVSLDGSLDASLERGPDGGGQLDGSIKDSGRIGMDAAVSPTGRLDSAA